jgi:hypothetical protein
MSDYLENKLIDHLFKATAFTAPAAMAVALFAVSKGQRANSTAYALNDTIWLTANDTKTHIYKCTTAGTTAAAQSTLYPGAIAEAITDGTAVFTEQSTAFDSNSNTAMEVSTTSTGYARVSINPSSTANWLNTQGTASGASSGTTGTTSNQSTITFGSPTATWGGAGAMIAAMGVYDATSAGNLLFWGTLTTPKTVNNGDAAPTFAASALSFQIDN